MSIINIDIELSKPSSRNHTTLFLKRKEKWNHILLLESWIALLEVLETPKFGFKNGKWKRGIMNHAQPEVFAQWHGTLSQVCSRHGSGFQTVSSYFCECSQRAAKRHVKQVECPLALTETENEFRLYRNISATSPGHQHMRAGPPAPPQVLSEYTGASASQGIWSILNCQQGGGVLWWPGPT